jgi:hypothetical protein
MVKQTTRVKLFSERELLKKAKERIISALSDVPFIDIRKSTIRENEQGYDFVFDVPFSGRPIRFLIDVKSQGEPRLVRMAIAQMKDRMKSAIDSYGILVAPYLSDASRLICKEAGIGSIDMAGNIFLSFRNLFIDRGGNVNPFVVTRFSRSVFSPKSSRILRVLLSDISRKWYVEELSREACISIGLVSRVKQTLLSEEWIAEENRRFYIVKPEEVLNYWCDNYSYTKNPVFSFYSGLSQDEIETALKRICKKNKYSYGLTLFSGAGKVAPFVRFMKFFSYIDGDIENIAAGLQLKKVETGANVTFLQPYDEGVFYGLQDIDDTKVVSDIQLYLDLKSYKGRGEEAAQSIFEQRIKTRW